MDGEIVGYHAHDSQLKEMYHSHGMKGPKRDGKREIKRYSDYAEEDMKTPIPLARAQQVIGVPEHPCETIVRNGALICPYEEMEVQFYPEHAGLYLVTLVGEPFEIFGYGKNRAKSSLKKGYLPIVQHETIQQGCQIQQTAYACLLDNDKVSDGTEKLINVVKLSISNLDQDSAKHFPITIVFGSCFRKLTDQDDPGDIEYWRNFLYRDDIAVDISPKRPIEPYPYRLTQKDDLLIAEGKGIVFCIDHYSTGDGEFMEHWGHGSWIEGTKFDLGWRMNLHLEPGETKEISYKVPYLPLELDEHNISKLRELDVNKRLLDTANMWDSLLNKGSILRIPGTDLENLWKAQTAATFILVDKQNKGSDRYYGRNIYSTWAEDYPNKVLDYVHLSPSLYEFIWAQEAAFWVIGMLDMQGYHKEAENYLELFFELQGEGTPGVHDRTILPDKNFTQSYMGTTPHAWLNSNGGVLLALAEHYKLTRNKSWLLNNKESILSACRWIKELRKATKRDVNSLGYGLMPPGQSTDLTFASDHLQWYYTDIWTLLGLTEIANVMAQCGIEEAEDLVMEAEDYKACFLRSLDKSILDWEDFKQCEGDYDFSEYLYYGALRHQNITEWDEKGVPTQFKNKIILKDEAQKMGMRCFIPMSPQTRIPFKEPYLDNGFTYALAYLSGIIDFSSETPIFAGASHTGKEIWDAIEIYCKETGIIDFDNKIYSVGLTYNDYLIKKFMDCDEIENVIDTLNFVLRYGCDKETHMGKESASAYLKEMWFQPCPFTLSMAVMRSWIRKSLVFEDEKSGKLVFGKAMQKLWMENAATWESPITLDRASTYYGHVSVEYYINFICTEIAVQLDFEEIERLPEMIEIRLNHPQNCSVKELVSERIDRFILDKDRGYVTISSSDIPRDGKIELRALYDVSV